MQALTPAEILLPQPPPKEGENSAGVFGRLSGQGTGVATLRGNPHTDMRSGCCLQGTGAG